MNPSLKTTPGVNQSGHNRSENPVGGVSGDALKVSGVDLSLKSKTDPAKSAEPAAEEDEEEDFPDDGVRSERRSLSQEDAAMKNKAAANIITEEMESPDA